MKSARGWMAGQLAKLDSLDPTSGAIDIIVTISPEGVLRSTPWHIRFGRSDVPDIARLPTSRTVMVEVNDVRLNDVYMLVDATGEAFFAQHAPQKDALSPLPPDADNKLRPGATMDDFGLGSDEGSDMEGFASDGALEAASISGSDQPPTSPARADSPLSHHVTAALLPGPQSTGTPVAQTAPPSPPHAAAPRTSSTSNSPSAVADVATRTLMLSTPTLISSPPLPGTASPAQRSNAALPHTHLAEGGAVSISSVPLCAGVRLPGNIASRPLLDVLDAEMVHGASQAALGALDNLDSSGFGPASPPTKGVSRDAVGSSAGSVGSLAGGAAASVKRSLATAATMVGLRSRPSTTGKPSEAARAPNTAPGAPQPEPEAVHGRLSSSSDESDGVAAGADQPATPSPSARVGDVAPTRTRKRSRLRGLLGRATEAARGATGPGGAAMPAVSSDPLAGLRANAPTDPAAAAAVARVDELRHMGGEHANHALPASAELANRPLAVVATDPLTAAVADTMGIQRDLAQQHSQREAQEADHSVDVGAVGGGGAAGTGSVPCVDRPHADAAGVGPGAAYNDPMYAPMETADAKFSSPADNNARQTSSYRTMRRFYRSLRSAVWTPGAPQDAMQAQGEPTSASAVPATLSTAPSLLEVAGGAADVSLPEAATDAPVGTPDTTTASGGATSGVADTRVTGGEMVALGKSSGYRTRLLAFLPRRPKKDDALSVSPPGAITATASLVPVIDESPSGGVATTKSVVPTSDQLALLGLNPGRNIIRFVLQHGAGGKEATVESRLFLWRDNSKVVISDLDGTVTKSDVLGQVLPALGYSWEHSGTAELYTTIARNGYNIIYLSSRSQSQAAATRRFIEGVRQAKVGPATAGAAGTAGGTVIGGAAAATAADASHHSLPDGPLIISATRIFTAFCKEVILRSPHEFKIASLASVRQCFPTHYNPFHAGFGNRATDVLSYQAVGMYPHRIFIISPSGTVRAMRNTFTSYNAIHDLVDLGFPGIKDDDRSGGWVARALTLARDRAVRAHTRAASASAVGTGANAGDNCGSNDAELEDAVDDVLVGCERGQQRFTTETQFADFDFWRTTRITVSDK